MDLEELSKKYGFKVDFDGVGGMEIYIRHRITGHIIKQIEQLGFELIDVFKNYSSVDELRVNFRRK